MTKIATKISLVLFASLSFTKHLAAMDEQHTNEPSSAELTTPATNEQIRNYLGRWDESQPLGALLKFCTETEQKNLKDPSLPSNNIRINDLDTGELISISEMRKRLEKKKQQELEIPQELLFYTIKLRTEAIEKLIDENTRATTDDSININNNMRLINIHMEIIKSETRQFRTDYPHKNLDKAFNLMKRLFIFCANKYILMSKPSDDLIFVLTQSLQYLERRVDENADLVISDIEFCKLITYCANHRRFPLEQAKIYIAKVPLLRF